MRGETETLDLFAPKPVAREGVLRASDERAAEDYVEANLRAGETLEVEIRGKLAYRVSIGRRPDRVSSRRV